MIENLVADIQNIEANADSIIAEAQKEAKQLDVNAQNEINQLAIDSEKEFQVKADELKLRIENSKKNEAAHLKSEFEKMKAQLTNINQKTLEQVIKSVVKEICES